MAHSIHGRKLKYLILALMLIIPLFLQGCGPTGPRLSLVGWEGKPFTSFIQYTGTIQNISKETFPGLNVRLSFEDDNGTVYYTEDSIVTPLELEPGATGSFTFFIFADDLAGADPTKIHTELNLWSILDDQDDPDFIYWTSNLK
jgi:hypothetical protein